MQDTDSVYGFGHTGLLIQNSKGVWYHLYWGATGGGKSGKGGVKCTIVELKGFKYQNLSQLNTSLNKKKDKNGNPIYSGKYEHAIYFSGNFSAGLTYANSLNKNYRLLSNNCMQICIEVLLNGTFSKNNTQYKAFLTKLRFGVIPNTGFLRMRLFNNTVIKWNSTPVYLRWSRISPTLAVSIC